MVQIWYLKILKHPLNKVAILSQKNEDVNKINLQVFNKLPSKEKTYLSSDSLKCEDDDDIRNYPVIVIHILKLKKGAIIILL